MDWELILIDDGSTDSSGKICDDYALNDTRIKVLHKKNEGVSIARNVGIQNALGEYLFFVDSDDILPLNALKDLYSAALNFNKPEYIRGNHEVILPDGKRIITKFAERRQPHENILLSSDRFLPDVCLFHPVVWGALYKKDFIDAFNVRFDRNGCAREDLLFHVQLASLNFNAVYIGPTVYIYRLAVSNSLSNSTSLKHLHSQTYICSQLYSSYLNLNHSRTKEVIQSIYSEIFLMTLRSLPRIKFSDRKEITNLCRKVTDTKVIKASGVVTKALWTIYRLNPSVFNIVSELIYKSIPKSKRID